MPNDFHLVHLGARAMGGAAMVVTEMTCVSPDARITPACPGMWNDEQETCLETHRGLRARAYGREDRAAAWTFRTQRLHAADVGGHRPAARYRELAAAFGLADPVYRRGFANAARGHARGHGAHQAGLRGRDERGEAAGFDWLELHCAHGYLLSSFISPLTNQRTDEYGGSLENRCRYPVEVFKAMREVWPQEKPMSVRISAHDWVPGGLTPEDAA